jgi:hypothetical protein
MSSLVYQKEFETYEKAWAFAVRVTGEGRGMVEEFMMVLPWKYVVAVRMSCSALP